MPVTRLISIIAGLLIALIPHPLHAGWARTWGGEHDDAGHCVEQTSDGGYIVAGRQEGKGGWLIKTDEAGDTLWTTSPSALCGGAAYCIQNTADNGYIITGYYACDDDGKYHLGLIKTDSLGETMWERLDMSWFTHDSTGGVGLSVQQTTDGGYILTGYRQPAIWEEITDLWLIKTDSAGELEWSKTHGAESPDCGHCVRQTSDDGYIIAGYTSTDWSLWVLKTDVNGDTVWVSGLEDWWYARAYSVEEISSGGYIVAGYGRPFEDGKDHLVVVKMTSDGDTIWTRMEQGWFPNDAGGVGRCVRHTSDGNYILTGYTSEWMDETNDLFLIKMNPDGDTLWTRIYGGADEDLGRCVGETADGGYIITGATKSFGAGGYDLWLIKTDASGDTLGISEKPPADPEKPWEILSPVGPEIVLQYSDMPQGFHAAIFDASGRKVDELHAPLPSGTISWGGSFGPGLYFIRLDLKDTAKTRKFILIE